MINEKLEERRKRCQEICKSFTARIESKAKLRKNRLALEKKLVDLGVEVPEETIGFLSYNGILNPAVGVPEQELIAYAKEYLKKQGFKKKGKRWTKITEEFILHFFIQGSQWDKEYYYIRPGIFINGVDPNGLYYGHFMITIDSICIEQIFKELEIFFKEWTNKKLIKERVTAFLEWDKRNPLEKRRANKVDYEKDPPPSYVLFGTPEKVLEYIKENF